MAFWDRKLAYLVWTNSEKGQYLAVFYVDKHSVWWVICQISRKIHLLKKTISLLPARQKCIEFKWGKGDKKASGSLSELGKDIRRLTNLAYPTATSTTELRKTVARDQFVDSLISVDMRVRLKQARRTYLNDAARHAIELEALNGA